MGQKPLCSAEHSQGKIDGKSMFLPTNSDIV